MNFVSGFLKMNTKIPHFRKKPTYFKLNVGKKSKTKLKTNTRQKHGKGVCVCLNDGWGRGRGEQLAENHLFGSC